jgi:pentatricopeptide repeat protein
VTVHPRLNVASFSSSTEVTEAPQPTPVAEHHDGEKRQRPPFKKGLIRNHRHKQPRDSAFALFNDVVKPESNAVTTQRSSLDEWAIAGKMKVLEGMDASPREKLQHFQQEIWPQLDRYRGQLPKHLYTSTTRFLSKTYQTIIANPQDFDLSAEVSVLKAKTNDLNTTARNALVLNLCHLLLTENHSPETQAAILKELNKMWQHISQLRRRSQATKKLQHALPNKDEVYNNVTKSRSQSGRQGEATHPLVKALAAIFPQFFPDQAQPLVSGLLATVAVLADPNINAQATQKEAARLLDCFDVAFREVEFDETDIAMAFDGRGVMAGNKMAELKAYVMREWQHVPAMLAEDAPWRQALKSSRARIAASPKMLQSLHVKLRAAYLARNTGGALSIWQDFRNYLAQQADPSEQLRSAVDFMDFWVFVWCAMRRPAKLQETLEVMAEHGLQPTIKTYTAMMHGWKMCKDIDKIEALWEKLVESGIALDNVIWTERLSSLVELGKTQQAVRALAEMLALWKAAYANNPNTHVVKPSIEVVNAVFKGLVALDADAARTVLAWAGREGIEPNIRTFNILLRESFKNGRHDQIQTIFKTMQAHGVEPDAATFTVMLEEVLGNMQNAPAAEQVQTVESILEDIQLAGIEANSETYGKMLYAVASLPQAEPAIAAIQAHMRRSGLSITPHMITILIERAINQPRPDIDAVRALLREHQLTHVGRGDQTLWERVMSAYAFTAHVDDALKVFDDLTNAGRPVTSLPCLQDLLLALLEAGRTQDARVVVSTVMQNKLKSPESADNRYWKHHFWHLARQNGLLPADARLPSATQ